MLAPRIAFASSRDMLSGPVAQRRSIDHTDHRPWPLPGAPWVMGQTWRRLLFAHWPLPPEEVGRVVPAQLGLDVRDGRAWVGVTPFEVSALRLRWSPPAPWVSGFPECNVRTYVTVDGKPGIYFFSLDAARRLAVEAARRVYRVPYFHARMRVRDGRDGWTHYELQRRQRDGPPAELRLRYAGEGRPFHARPGSLEHFLTERYCLYTLDSRRRIRRADIHHRPWSLRAANGEISVNTMGEGLGLDLRGRPVLHLSDRQDVVFWPLSVVEACTGGPVG